MNLDVRAVRRGHGVARVKRLAARAIHVEINQRDLRGKLKIRDLVEYGRTDVARSNDDNFSPVD